MSSAQAHMHHDDDPGGHDGPVGAPILMTDIDRVLRESAAVTEAGAGEPVPIREWRDELAVALESLAYAQAVLSADVGILRHRLSADDGDGPVPVDELPHVLSSRPWGEGWSAPCGSEGPSRADWEIFARSDQLMSAHQEMARIDLSSRDDVSRLIRSMEHQLIDLNRRQQSVESRLHEIRAAIVRQYEAGAVTAEDWLG